MFANIGLHAKFAIQKINSSISEKKKPGRSHKCLYRHQLFLLNTYNVPKTLSSNTLVLTGNLVLYLPSVQLPWASSLWTNTNCSVKLWYKCRYQKFVIVVIEKVHTNKIQNTIWINVYRKTYRFQCQPL